jgi:hypothetical protein
MPGIFSRPRDGGKFSRARASPLRR